MQELDEYACNNFLRSGMNAVLSKHAGEKISPQFLEAVRIEIVKFLQLYVPDVTMDYVFVIQDNSNPSNVYVDIKRDIIVTQKVKDNINDRIRFNEELQRVRQFSAGNRVIAPSRLDNVE